MKLLKVDQDDSVEIVPHEDGLLIKKIDAASAYRQISKETPISSSYIKKKL